MPEVITGIEYAVLECLPEPVQRRVLHGPVLAGAAGDYPLGGSLRLPVYPAAQRQLGGGVCPASAGRGGAGAGAGGALAGIPGHPAAVEDPDGRDPLGAAQALPPPEAGTHSPLAHRRSASGESGDQPGGSAEPLRLEPYPGYPGRRAAPGRGCDGEPGRAGGAGTHLARGGGEDPAHRAGDVHHRPVCVFPTYQPGHGAVGLLLPEDGEVGPAAGGGSDKGA